VTPKYVGVSALIMGYVVKKTSGKRSWRLQFESRKGVRTCRDIKEDELRILGFSALMSLDQARSMAQSLNAKEHLKRKENNKSLIVERLRADELKVNAQFPSAVLKEFEMLFVPKDSRKLQSHWRVCKKLILELAIDYSDWAYHKQVLYKLLLNKNFSYEYIKKIISLLNKWGRHMARKQNKNFETIPAPTSRDKERIIDNHMAEKGEFASAPIPPADLEKNAFRFSKHHYNWLYLSVWLGLRPNEVDRLLEPAGKKTWYFEDDVLWVYQSKLVGIPAAERLKPIPIKLKEQKKCIAIIKSGKFKRPLVKTVKAHLGEDVTCYGGRKGFTDLMLGHGNSIEAISQWMGHRSLDMTWKTYKNKKKVLID
jgi:integrase